MLQPSSTFKESLEENNGFFLKTKETPFLDSFPDPLCNLNLKETSEFVKAFPMSSSCSSNGKREGVRRLEAHPTPSRPVFSFSVGTNLTRKGFPSEWDDAQKWLISTTTDSPSQHTKPRLQFDQKAEKPNVSSWDASAFNGDFAKVLLKDKFTREEEEEEISKSLRHFESGDGYVKNRLDSRYQRAKIQAWVNLQTAKAEAQSRKLEREAKIEKEKMEGTSNFLHSGSMMEES